MAPSRVSLRSSRAEFMERVSFGTVVRLNSNPHRCRSAWTPSGFYSEKDAVRARDGARLTVSLVKPHVPDVE
jgi:hypothetical protein